MMKAEDLGVRVEKAFENRKVGQVIFPPGLLRSHLLRGGYVTRVAAPVATYLAPVVDAIKRRGRPRKASI